MIPFNKPVWIGTEPARIAQAIVENGHVASGGPFGVRCEVILSQRLGQPTLLTSSCTHALEMAALLLDIQPGDEVILPSFAFVSAANAFALRGADISFVDVDQDGNIDPSQVAAALSRHTRAVVVVHYAGNSCNLSQLLDACGKVPLVEDAAQAMGASFAGRPLGTWGTFSTFSFHETKNIGCGEGGAISLREEVKYLEQAHMIRDKGTNRQSFIAGQVGKYTWTSLGSSYGLSDLNAAYLLGQLEALEIIQARRRTLYMAYHEALSTPLERAGGYLVRTGSQNTPNHHLFAMVLRDGEQRDAFIAHMKAHDIVTPFHYVALHLSPMGKRFRSGQRSLKHSERLSTCLVRLPLFFNLTDRDQAQVIDRTLEFLNAI